MKELEFEIMNINTKIVLGENKLKQNIDSMKGIITDIEVAIENGKVRDLNSCGEFQDLSRITDSLISNLTLLHGIKSNLESINKNDNKNNAKDDNKSKYLNDDQFDELMEHLSGSRLTQAEGMKNCGFEGMKLTKGQINFRNENYKRCSRCKTWIGSSDACC